MRHDSAILPPMSSQLGATALFLVLSLGSVVVAAPGCSSASSGAAGVGVPCVPQTENDPAFRGFRDQEVSVESGSPSCPASSVCLLNHFRGRVSCPYGQSADGTAPAGAVGACKTPNGAAVTGDPNDPRAKALVPPQCVDRAAARAVYCSCRCADGAGRTAGADLCACPDGFECTSLVTSIGASTSDLAGSYCVKSGTAYDASTACSQGDCDPVAKKCE